MQPTAVAVIVATAEIATAQALGADMKKILAPLGGALQGMAGRVRQGRWLGYYAVWRCCISGTRVVKRHPEGDW